MRSRRLAIWVLRATLTVTMAAGVTSWLLGAGASEDGLALFGGVDRSRVVRPGASVWALVTESSAETIGVLIRAMVLGTALGVALAALTGARARGAVMLLLGLVSAVPVFLIGAWTLEAFNEGARLCLSDSATVCPEWFPLPTKDHPLRSWLAAVALVVGGGALADASAVFSSEWERVSTSEFVRFTKGLGLSVWPHYLVHLPEALGGLTLTLLFRAMGAAVIAELVFSIPGLGKLTWDAAVHRDAPLLVGAVVAWSVALVLVRGGLLAMAELTSGRGAR